MFLDPSTPMQVQIIAGLKQITDAVERWAIPLAAIGSVSMAFIQAVKNVTPIRSGFQRWRLRKWLEASFRDLYDGPRETRSQFQLRRLREWLTAGFGGLYNRLRKSGKWGHSEKEQREPRRKVEQAATTAAEQEAAPMPKGEMVERVRTDLIRLATSGDEAAFYALPIEDLCDQIRKVVSVILDYPLSNKYLLYLLARGAKGDDIKEILQTQSVDAKSAAFREYAAAKNRLLVQTRCSVDAIQTSIGYRWKFCLQLGAMILSGVLGVIALDLGVLAAEKGAMSRSSKILMLVLFGILAGFVAPVARDVVAGIEKWRS